MRPPPNRGAQAADIDNFRYKRHGGNEGNARSGIDCLDGRGKIFRSSFTAQLSEHAREIETCLFQLENEIIKREAPGDGSSLNAFEPEKKRAGPSGIGQMHGRDGDAVDAQETLDSVFGASLLLHEAKS